MKKKNGFYETSVWVPENLFVEGVIFSRCRAIVTT
jgi:hypothetical protein